MFFSEIDFLSFHLFPFFVEARFLDRDAFFSSFGCDFNRRIAASGLLFLLFFDFRFG